MPTTYSTPHLQPSSTASRYSHGFTVVELVVTTAVLGILAAIAAPNLNGLLQRWQVRRVTENLQSSLEFARSEAIKRGGNVVMQKITTNPNGCVAPAPNREWDCGWFICADINSNNKCTANEPVLLRYDNPSRTHISRTGGAASIAFNRYGLVAGAYIGFNLVPHNQNLNHPATHGLCMSSGGRIRTVKSEEVPCNG